MYQMAPMSIRSSLHSPMTAASTSSLHSPMSLSVGQEHEQAFAPTPGNYFETLQEKRIFIHGLNIVFYSCLKMETV